MFNKNLGGMFRWYIWVHEHPRGSFANQYASLWKHLILSYFQSIEQMSPICGIFQSSLESKVTKF